MYKQILPIVALSAVIFASDAKAENTSLENNEANVMSAEPGNDRTNCASHCRSADCRRMCGKI
jgi:hypothetical protein